MRYEDLILNKERELTGLFKFLLDMDDLAGTNIERRIQQVIKSGDNISDTYQLKNTSMKLNSGLSYFTKSQIDYIKETNREFLHIFGYTN